MRLVGGVQAYEGRYAWVRATTCVRAGGGFDANRFWEFCFFCAHVGDRQSLTSVYGRGDRPSSRNIAF